MLNNVFMSNIYKYQLFPVIISSIYMNDYCDTHLRCSMKVEQVFANFAVNSEPIFKSPA